jgi:hypothetical protein
VIPIGEVAPPLLARFEVETKTFKNKPARKFGAIREERCCLSFRLENNWLRAADPQPASGLIPLA